MTVYTILAAEGEKPCLMELLHNRGHEVHVIHVPATPAGAASEAFILPESTEVIVEALPEHRAQKVAALRGVNASELPVLTTSAIHTVFDLGADSGCGNQLAGFHHLADYGSQLAELVTEGHAPESGAAARALAADLGIEAIETVDVPGRLSRRLLVPFIDNALQAEELGIASTEGIDDIVRLGLGHERGPLARVKEAGLAEHTAASEALRSNTTEKRIEGDRV